MADYRQAARHAAERVGLDPNIFERQIGAESAFNPHARSPAGARGIAQIMPDTARGWGVNPDDPIASLNAAARNMKRYVDQFGNYGDALRAYNAGPGNVQRSRAFAETNAYVAKILHGRDPGGGGGGGGSSSPAAPQYAVATSRKLVTPAVDNSRERLSLAQSFLSGTGNNPLSFVQGLRNRADIPAQYETNVSRTRVPDASASASSAIAPSAHAGRVIVAPGANRAGAKVSQEALQFFGAVAGHVGQPIKVTTGTNHNRLTVDGNVSDHWDGHAGDFGVPIDSHQGDLLAAHALVAAGLPWDKAWKMARVGGLYTITPASGRFKGHRVQVIWKTMKGGNHHNHVHIGIR